MFPCRSFLIYSDLIKKRLFGSKQTSAFLRQKWDNFSSSFQVDQDVTAFDRSCQSKMTRFRSNSNVLSVQHPLNVVEARRKSSGFIENGNDDDELISSQYFDYKVKSGEKVFVIQPVIKKSNPLTTPELQLAESIALVESLSDWKVVGKHVETIKNFSLPKIFPENILEKLKAKVKLKPQVSILFVSIQQLTPNQRKFFKELFEVEKVFDRYTVVLQIFKERAQTKEAELQVALAEIPYSKKNLILTAQEECPHRQKQGYVVESFQNIVKREFHIKEQKLRKRLKFLSKQRDLHRRARKKSEVPIVAVVGYTNAGKTSLIKALSQAEKIQPKDQLFATLDVTAHSAVFPNKLRYVLVDTVGFLSDLPLKLFDAFSATMEDMLHADLVVHVRDESHPDRRNQLKNVIGILSKLKLSPGLIQNIVEVRNKIDLVQENFDSSPKVIWPKKKKLDLKPGQLDLRPVAVCGVSVTQGVGLKTLIDVLERVVMTTTKRRRVRFLVPTSGHHLDWLRSNCCVEDLTGHGDYQYLVEVIVTEAQWNSFLSHFDDVEVVKDTHNSGRG